MGRKNCDGIDCSALIQIYFTIIIIFFPRDTKDQIKYCKKKLKKIYKGDIIFWKGHVGICLNIKIYSCLWTKKKSLIMPTKNYKLIKKTAKLKVKKISNIKNY